MLTHHLYIHMVFKLVSQVIEKAISKILFTRGKIKEYEDNLFDQG